MFSKKKKKKGKRKQFSTQLKPKDKRYFDGGVLNLAHLHSRSAIDVYMTAVCCLVLYKDTYRADFSCLCSLDAEDVLHFNEMKLSKFIFFKLPP